MKNMLTFIYICRIYNFFYYILSIVALKILYSVTALADLSSFTSCGVLQFDSPSFLTNNLLSSPGIFNFQLIIPMF